VASLSWRPIMGRHRRLALGVDHRRRQHELVLRIQPKTDHLATQYRHPMTKEEQFDVLRGLATSPGHDESQQHPEGRIQSAEQHPNDHAEPSKHTGPRFLSPTGSESHGRCPLVDAVGDPMAGVQDPDRFAHGADRRAAVGVVNTPK